MAESIAANDSDAPRTWLSSSRSDGDSRRGRMVDGRPRARARTPVAVSGAVRVRRRCAYVAVRGLRPCRHALPVRAAVRYYGGVLGARADVRSAASVARVPPEW